MPPKSPSFSPFGNAEVPPPFLMPAPKPEIDRSIVPDVSVDATFDRDEVLQRTPISEASPVLGGLRRVILERRIERDQAKIEELAETQRVVKHAGEEITSAGSYATLDDELRPAIKPETRITKKLEKIFKKRRHEQAKSAGLAEAHPWMESVSDDYPGKTQRPRLSRAETRNLEQTTTYHQRLGKEVHHLDTRFKRVVTRPSRRAEQLIRHRDKMVQKSASIEAAVNKKNWTGQQPPELPIGYADWDDYIARRGR